MFAEYTNHVLSLFYRFKKKSPFLYFSHMVYYPNFDPFWIHFETPLVTF